MGWVVLFVLFYLSPALKDGPAFGPADLGSTLAATLTKGAVPLATHCLSETGAASVGCAHNSVNGDIIDQAIPWNTLDWRLVHAGELPLWNSLSGTGLPQFVNFESAAAALPSLVGYLVPLSVSFLVTIAMKLLIAGLGTYFCCRMLRARPAAAALGATSFMLSGAISGWLGWSISGVLVWAGAIAGAAIWAYRSRGGVGPIALLAVSIAFAVYGGFPEDYVLVAIFFGVLFVVTAVAIRARRDALGPRGVGRLAIGALLGIMFSAPLWLPGLSVLRQSVRTGELGATGLPLHYLALLFVPGYDGLPIAGSFFFANVADQGLYFETASSVGLIALALAGVAVVLARRRPVVIGLAVAGLACLAMSFRLGSVSPVQRLLIDVGLRSVILSRSLALADFAICVLGALGLELVLARARERAVVVALGGSTAALGLVVVVLGVKALRPGLPSAFASLRRDSLIWPVATLAMLVLVVIALVVLQRRAEDRSALSPRRVTAGIAAALVGVQSAAVLFAGVGINSYARSAYPVTAEVAQLRAVVGGALLGIDAGNVDPRCAVAGVGPWLGIGLYPEMNVAYSVDELALHDPTAPEAIFSSWPIPTPPGASCGGTNLFVPNVDSVALARRYGVGFVLAGPGRPAPAGMVRVARIGGVFLYRVPGAVRFTVSGAGAVTSTRHLGDASYLVVVRARARATLIARITDSPGWSATVSGRGAPIRRVDGAFLAVALPAGTSEVTFTYRPQHFDVAIALAVMALLVLVGLELVWHRPARVRAATVARDRARQL